MSIMSVFLRFTFVVQTPLDLSLSVCLLEFLRHSSSGSQGLILCPFPPSSSFYFLFVSRHSILLTIPLYINLSIHCVPTHPIQRCMGLDQTPQHFGEAHMLQEHWYSPVSINMYFVWTALTFHHVTRSSLSTLGWATFCTRCIQRHPNEPFSGWPTSSTDTSHVI